MMTTRVATKSRRPTKNPPALLGMSLLEQFILVLPAGAAEPPLGWYCPRCDCRTKKYMQRHFGFFLALVAVWLLVGCTSYKEAQHFGQEGYYSRVTRNSTVQITYTGEQFTPKQQVLDFAYLRAAELAIENGFTHFAVIRETVTIRTQRHTATASAKKTRALPGAAGVVASPSASSSNTVGTSGSVGPNYNTITTPGSPGGTFGINVNEASLEVVFVKIDTVATPEKKIVEAAAVKTRIKAAYSIK